MKRIIPVIFGLWAIVCQAQPRTECQRYIESVVKTDKLRAALVSVRAQTVSGKVLADFNSTLRINPASNMKLLTTGTALKELGPEFRFETSVGYTGEISDGSLVGDIYIIGGGDPSLGAKYEGTMPVDSVFSQWMQFIREAGIKEVKGRIIGCDNSFPLATQTGEWKNNNMIWDYAAIPRGLNFYRNCQDIVVFPNGSVEVIYPKTEWQCYSDDCPKDAEGENRPVSQNCSNPFPGLTCAYLFNDFLKNNGMATEGYSEQRNGPEDLVVLGSTYSEPLRCLIEDMNRESDNLYAELIWMKMGEEKQDSILCSMSLAGKEYISIVDGSGMTTSDYVTTEFMVSFLKEMQRSDEFEDFFNSLPYPGKGTLKYIFRNQPHEFKERIHMKSGSIDGVRSFSGYILPQSGNPSDAVSFSVIVNHSKYSSSEITKIEEGIIEGIVREFDF